jgi:hypothetical protein
MEWALVIFPVLVSSSFALEASAANPMKALNYELDNDDSLGLKSYG